MLTAAPALMKFLSIAGTIAMFLVGGGILTHSIGFLHHIAEAFIALAPSFSLLLSITFDGIAGVVAGAIIALALQAWTKIRAT